MTDIVLGRHRYYRRADRNGDWWSASGMVSYRQADALDEIERLRDLAYYECGQGNQCTWRDRWEVTAAALEEANRQIRRLEGKGS